MQRGCAERDDGGKGKKCKTVPLRIVMSEIDMIDIIVYNISFTPFLVQFLSNIACNQSANQQSNQSQWCTTQKQRKFNTSRWSGLQKA